MPRGGARPGAGRKPKPKPEGVATPAKRAATPVSFAPQGVKTEEAPKSWPFGQEPESSAPVIPPKPADITPLDYFKELYQDEEADPRLRLQAAALAAPYLHAKPAPLGKKETQRELAKGPNKFAAATPPKLVAAGGKKV